MTFEDAFNLMHDYFYDLSLMEGNMTNLESLCNLYSVVAVAFKFYGKTPQTGEEWYTFYEKLGRSYFDKIDSNKDGFVDKVMPLLVLALASLWNQLDSFRCYTQMPLNTAVEFGMCCKY